MGSLQATSVKQCNPTHRCQIFLQHTAKSLCSIQGPGLGAHRSQLLYLLFLLAMAGGFVTAQYLYIWAQDGDPAQRAAAAAQSQVMTAPFLPDIRLRPDACSSTAHGMSPCTDA